MSQNIDKRIVEMRFDNKQFESGIQTSVKSLDELKKGLDFDKAVKGLSGLEKAGRSFNLSGISDGVSAISDRFTAMGIVGMRVLQNLTDAAYNCGKRMISALTVDPVKTGFAEYETQIGAIQTILANTSDAMNKKGYSEQQKLDVVNSKLDELNTYADKTIYNFTEMTRNIGTFTAAGVELDTAVSSIKGIANLAAVSGSTSQQASTAMYQLSQAISTGTVRLQDWNSVVNAGMGGELFQKALTRTASKMGVVGDEAKEVFAKLQNDQISFRDSLSSGWLSSDILTATLAQMSMDFEKIAKERALFLEDGTADIEAAKDKIRADLIGNGYTKEEADDIVSLAQEANDAATKVKTLTQLFDTLKESLQSGWTQSWEYIIGDFKEARDLLTNVSDYFGAIIEKSAKSRNILLSNWKTLGGRNELINGLWNVIHAFENIAGVVKGAFKEFFPPMTGQQLLRITKSVTDFTAKIKAATENSELMGKVSRVFRGAAAALDIVRTAAGWAWDGLKKLFGATQGVAGGFLDFAAGVGDWVVSLRDSIKNSRIFQGILNGLGSAASSVRDLMVGGIKKVGAFFMNLWEKIKAAGIFTKVGDWFNNFIGQIPESIEKIKSWGKSIVDWVKSSEKLQAAWKNIKGFFEPIINGISDFGRKLWEAIKSFFSADTSSIENLGDKIKTRFSAFGAKIGEWFESIKPKLIEAWINVKAFIAKLFTKTIPNFFSRLKMKAISKWPWLEKVFAFFENVWNKVKNVCGPAVEKIKGLGKQLWESVQNIFGGGQNAPKEGEISLGESLMNSVTERWEKIKGFFSDFFTVTIPQWFDKLKGVDWGSIIKNAFGIIAAIKLFSLFDGIGNIGKGLISIGKGLTGVGDFIKDTIKNGGITQIVKHKDSFATSLLKVAAAIGIMVAAILVLSNMEAERALTGFKRLTLLALELVTISALFKIIDVNGDAMMRAAAAVALLVIPIYLLGSMDTTKAYAGIFRVGVILTELGICMKIAGAGMKGKQSLIGLAIAVNLLVLAVNLLGNMKIETAIQGMIGIGLILLEMSWFTNMTDAKKISGLIAMAISVNLLVFAVKKMGSLNWKTIIKGVLGLGAIVAAFALLINSAKDLKFGSSLSALLLMAGSMLVFSEAIKRMDGIPWQTIAAFSAGLVGIVLAMTAVIKLLGNVDPLAAGKAAAALAIISVGLGAAIAILAGFVGGAASGLSDDIFRIGSNLKAYSDSVSQLDSEKIRTSMTLMEELATMMATVATKDTSGFEDTASQITLLGGRLGLFSILVSGVAPDGAANARKMVDDISYMAGKMKEMQDNSIDLTMLGAALTNFGSGIQLYATACQNASSYTIPEDGIGVDSSSLTKLFTALGDVKIDDSTIANVASYAEGGGNDLTSFALGLTAIGNAITNYGNSIQSIKLLDAIKSAIVLGMINDLQNKLPRENSIIDRIAGQTQPLSNFADNIVVLGGAMQSFAGCFTSDTAPLAERAVGVIDSLVEIEKSLDSHGGISAIFGGDKNLGAFGTNLNILGSGFNSFIGALNDYKGKETLVSSATGIIESLATIQGKLSYTDGIAQWSTGTQNIGTFGTNLNTLAEKFVEFCKKLADVTIPGNMEDIKKTVDQFADIAVKLNGVTMTYDLADNIKWYGTNLKKFFSTDDGIGGVTVDNDKLTSIGDFADAMADVAVKLNGISQVDDGVMQGLLNELSGLSIPELVDTGADSAKTFLDCLIAGIQNGEKPFSAAVISLVNAGNDAANSMRVQWFSTGQYLSIGIANGIGSMAGAIRNAAINAASGAIRAIQVTWSVHSPSKVGEELGMYWDLGISGGIDKYAGLITQSSAGIGISAIDTAKSVLNNLSYMTDDIDSQPTIRPVMDLSDVTNGFQTIDGLFGSRRAVNGTFFAGISSLHNGRAMTDGQGGVANRNDNRDVVTELQKLSERFDDLSTAVSNMQVVLDTGALVGQTASQMDAQLGAFASRKGRGN